MITNRNDSAKENIDNHKPYACFKNNNHDSARENNNNGVSYNT